MLGPYSAFFLFVYFHSGQESGALTFIDVSSTGNTDASISVTSPEIPFEGEIHSTLTVCHIQWNLSFNVDTTLVRG